MSNISMSLSPVILRPMTPYDLPGGLHLSTIAHWNQLEADWKLLYQLHPEGAFVAIADQRIIGTVTTAAYQSQTGWIAMVLVDPDYRGQGIATRLMEHALDALHHQQCVRLDATPAGKHVYNRMGFKDDYSLKRFTGKQIFLPESGFTGTLRPMREEDLVQVIQMDFPVLQAERSELLRGLLKMAPEYAWVSEIDQILTGFIMGRHGLHFELMGPLMASNIQEAQALLGILLQQIGPRPVAMDCPDQASDWQSLLLSLGMKVERPFTRMTRGNVLPLEPANNLFALAGPELG